jgi:hypothetical protein
MAAPPESVSVKLGLKETQIAGTTVYYEACFEEKLPVFETLLNRYRESVRDNAVTRHQHQRTPMLEALNAIVGGDDALFRKQAEIFDDMAEGFDAQIQVFQKAAHYLIRRDTIKDYLRKGHTLPNFTYDEQTDTAAYMAAIQIASDTGPQGVKELTFPLSSVERFEAEVEFILKMFFVGLQEEFFGTILHEIAEVSIFERMRSSAPDIRWFTDGMANVITAELLRNHYSKDAADQFLAVYSTAPYQDIEKIILLRYWMQMKYWDGGKVSVASEEKLNYARYCFATYEAQRLTEVHGIGCIGKIIDVFTVGGKRDGDDLLEAVHQVTGEDLRQRFLRYQHFVTRQEGRTHYMQQYRAAKQEKNQANQLFVLARLLELSESPYAQETLTIRAQLACVLVEMGHPEKGDQMMRDTVAYLSEVDKDGETIGKKAFMVYAIHANRPEIADEYAEQVLTASPEDLIALTVKTLTAGNQGRKEDAKKLVEKIRVLEDNSAGPYTRIVEQYLSED